MTRALDTSSLNDQRTIQGKINLKFDFESDKGWIQFDEYLKERSYVDG